MLAERDRALEIALGVDVEEEPRDESDDVDVKEDL